MTTHRTIARIGQRPAHESVTALAATKLHRRDGVAWTVSGDETRLAHGYVGMRKAGKRSIWTGVEMHGVLQDPLIATTCTGCFDTWHPHAFDCPNA